MSQNGVIGKDGTLPWHLSTDLQRFRKKTLTKPVIMGRKTFDSIGKPLDNRLNIVISRTLDLNSFADKGRVIVLPSVEEARCYVNVYPEAFVIGGGELYRLFMPIADKIYLSVIPKDYEGDTTFPEIDPTVWKKDHVELIKDAEINYYYFEYVRVKY